MTLLIMTIPVTLNTDITFNDITYSWFYLYMTLIITVNKNINVINVILYFI